MVNGDLFLFFRLVEEASNMSTPLDDVTGWMGQQGTGQAVDHTNTVMVSEDKGPMYDDLVLTIEQSPPIKTGEVHEYHVPYSPNEMKAFQIGANTIDETQSPSKHNYEIILGEVEEPQPTLKHDYETMLGKVETDDLQVRHNIAYGSGLVKERPTTHPAK